MANHATYQAYLNKLTALGYTLPSADQQYWQNKLIEDLDTAGAISRMDAFWLFLQDSSQNSVGVNIVDPDNFQLTQINSPTWTSNVGYQGSGVTQYLETGWIPNVHAVNYTAASASIWLGIGSDVNGNEIDTGDISNLSGRVFIRPRTSNKYGGQINASGTSINGGTVTTSIARTLWDRLSDNITVYSDGASAYSVASTVGSLPTGQFYLMAANNSGGSLNNSSRLLKYVAYAASMRDIIADVDAAFASYEANYTSPAPAPGDTTPPSVPTGLTEVAKTDTTVQIIWTASTDDTAVDGYRVYVDGVAVNTTASTGYTFSGLTPETEYDFTVSAYDAAANESAESAALTITTEATPAAPAFDTHPASLTADEDTLVTFTVSVSGVPAPTLQWQINTGSGWNDLSGETSTSYAFTCEVTDAGNQYRCVATNSEGTTNSNAATLTVNDTTAPSGPTSLTEDDITDTTLDVSWTASTDNVAVSGYQVYINDVLDGTTATTSYSFTGLTPETSYAVKVRAYDAAANYSAYSNTLNSTTEAAPAPPSFTTQPSTQSVDDGSNASFTVVATGNPTPTYQWQVNTGSGWGNISGATEATYTFAVDLADSGNQYRCIATNTVDTATSTAATLTVNDVTAPSAPSALNSTGKTHTTIDISWTASTDNVAVEGYKIIVDDVLEDTTASTTYQITGLSPETEYSIKVVAYDTADNDSAASNTIAITTDAAPDVTAPTVPSGLTLVNRDHESVQISWNASTDDTAVDGYRVYVDGVAVNTTASTGYTFTGLAASTSYDFTVSAFDAAANESAESTALKVSTTAAPDVTAPTVPTGLTVVSKTQTNISISWTASTDAVGVTGYRVYLDGSQVGTTAATNYNFTGLTANTAYSLTVAAYDGAGNVSAQSVSLEVTTEAEEVVVVESTTTGRGYIGKVIYNLIKDAYVYHLQKRATTEAATVEAIDCQKAQVLSLSKVSISGTEGALQEFINKSGTKVSPMVSRQTAKAPRLVYQVLWNEPSDYKFGPSKLDQIRVRISCHAAEYEQCQNIQQELRELIDRYSGTVAGMDVQSVSYIDEGDQYSEDAELCGVFFDYKIRFPR